MQGLEYVVADILISTCEKGMLRQNSAFGGFSSITRLVERNYKFCNTVFCAWVCVVTKFQYD